LRVAGAHHGERRIERARVLGARQRVADQIAESVSKPTLELHFERLITRVVLGVDHVDASEELRVREEVVRAESRKLRQRAAALDALTEGLRQAGH
jgi:hypothetical protein